MSRSLLADEFQRHRQYLRAVAYRMLGSETEADDALQEAWLRLDRRPPDDTSNLRPWLTTVVGGRIREIDIVGDPAKLRSLKVR